MGGGAAGLERQPWRWSQGSRRRGCWLVPGIPETGVLGGPRDPGDGGAGWSQGSRRRGCWVVLLLRRLKAWPAPCGNLVALQAALLPAANHHAWRPHCVGGGGVGGWSRRRIPASAGPSAGHPCPGQATAGCLHGSVCSILSKKVIEKVVLRG